jgi:serine/threonine-protein kinase
MDLQPVLEQRAKVEEFTRKHRIGLLTLLFTDVVGSTELKVKLGEAQAIRLLQGHRQVVRELLARFQEAEEIETAGDSFFIVFAKPSEAAQFALWLQSTLRAARQSGSGVVDRIGIHVGEVFIQEHEAGGKGRDLYGLQVDVAARVMSLAEGDQILLTRAAFDHARQVLKGQEVEGLNGSNRLNELQWLNHEPYLLKGVEEPLEICEVGESGQAVLKPPPDSEKVHRYVSPDAEPVLGWRPAIGQAVPGTSWLLEEKLGEGGFGEVWLGRHGTTKERRVFKFCFRADRVRALKREVTLFRLLKERVGEHPNVVRLLDVFFEEPPFYLEMEFVAGRDLKTWSKARGGLAAIPLETRLEIVAQIADALQAAHDAGVIHRDVKPSNILIQSRSRGHETHLSKSEIGNHKSEIKSEPPYVGSYEVGAKLTDFGIGQVVSEEALAGLTKLGFTQTMMSPGSSAQTGTQMYMAPELIAGQPASTRSDIYALGVVLCQLIVGDFSHPVTTDWAEEISDSLLKEDLKRCFAGRPEQRFSGAGQLAEHLRSLGKRQAALVEQKAAFAAREKAAYRRGIMRTGAVAGLIVAAFALLAGYAFNEASRATRTATEEARQRKLADEAQRKTSEAMAQL